MSTQSICIVVCPHKVQLNASEMKCTLKCRYRSMLWGFKIIIQKIHYRCNKTGIVLFLFSHTRGCGKGTWNCTGFIKRSSLFELIGFENLQECEECSIFTPLMTKIISDFDPCCFM